MVKCSLVLRVCDLWCRIVFSFYRRRMHCVISTRSTFFLWHHSYMSSPVWCTQMGTVKQCWNWPKRTGGGGVICRNVWNFAQGLKFKADFHSKMSVCRHELGGSTPTPEPRQFQPCCQVFQNTKSFAGCRWSTTRHDCCQWRQCFLVLLTYWTNQQRNIVVDSHQVYRVHSKKKR